MPFREWIFAFRESLSEFRERLREYPGTLRELREWPFHSESVFLEIGVVPRLLRNFLKNGVLIDASKSVSTKALSSKHGFPFQGLCFGGVCKNYKAQQMTFEKNDHLKSSY